MCCLFGVIDYTHSLKQKQLNNILNVLATACEDRGTDATGIAYFEGTKLRIYKKPWPGRFMRFRMPHGVHVVMGHTRMTTQGYAAHNYNNHPFGGYTRDGQFALAHNGVLYNDEILRQDFQLPNTIVETDSYIAVQLLEHQKHLNFETLGFTMEQLVGSATITVLDHDGLYIAKGDNPMCIYHFPRLGIYLYASTEAILNKAVGHLFLARELHSQVKIKSGEILHFDNCGNITRSSFDDDNFYGYGYNDIFAPYCCGYLHDYEENYVKDLKAVAPSMGYAPEQIDHLLELGFAPEEIEEFLYTYQREI